MRADRPSLTASLVAAVRAVYSDLPEPYRLASDPSAEALLPFSLRQIVKLARAGSGAPGLVHDALSLATFGLSLHVELRTRAIDDALREAVAKGIAQVVILGAGLDLRALRLPELGNATVFEIDHPSTQRYKVERLAAVASPPSSGARAIVRVAVDFEKDRIEDALPKAGFDREAPSFWIWEGVTIYLTRAAIELTLGAIATLSAPSSRLVVTYSELKDRRVPAYLVPVALAGLALVGERVETLFTEADLWSLLESKGFSKISDETTDDWARRYYGSDRFVRPIERLAIAERERSIAREP